METPVAATKSSRSILRFMAAPSDILHAGAQGVSGGRVLQWIDKAAYACAVQWSGSYCVTAYVGHIHFTRPIPSGHIVEVRSRIAMTGRTSMHIVNEVLSADPREGVFTRACDCLVIFIAKNPETGEKVEVPTFVPADAEDERTLAAAQSRIELRRAIDEEMRTQTYTDDSTAPRTIHRFLAKPTDVNWGGKVHGGSAMEWIDEAATACTMEWSGERTVAVYAGSIRFQKPISIGDLVEVDARITRTDARSMHIAVQVRSGNPRGGRHALTHAIHATFTYLAVDLDGQPLPARQFTPVTEEDKRLWDHTRVLKELRQRYTPEPLVRPADAQQHID
ncbi:acyl-CoA thioesterase [Corynebacterium liangguodongii]|uniref:Acyl-CoA thioesterase n=1 Tax=Corynebacterium liangguodongii TaxID=2079535 RepID=A0A2S0WFQ7_9CORY|nr:acyl-CoA thioesterase [Corynebacterium liangguodongii]AWB84617.1 acyl-CoA thioesterase [Corynebacterium liangguodongii]PWB99625.1 acyl-CoA thioesterase [Corynebacterium liangguodongii]